MTLHEAVEGAAVAACVVIINAVLHAFGELLHDADVALHRLEGDALLLQQIRDGGRAEGNGPAVDGEIVYLDVAEGLGRHVVCAVDAVVFAVEGERPGEIERLVVLPEENDVVEVGDMLAVDENLLAVFGLGDGLRPADRRGMSCPAGWRAGR